VPINPEQGVIAADDSAQIDVQTWQLSQRVFSVDTSKPTVVKVQTFWFPGWGATINGQAVNDNLLSDDGLIQLNVPAGTSQVVVGFSDTPVRTTGAVASIVAGFILAGLLIYSLLQQSRVKAKV
jgi:hypothetical protein